MTTTPTRECQNQVKDKDDEEALFYCLVTKEFLHECPPKCPYVIPGAAIPMDRIYGHNYEMECIHLHLLASLGDNDEQRLVCGKTGEEPDPQNCCNLK